MDEYYEQGLSIIRMDYDDLDLGIEADYYQGVDEESESTGERHLAAKPKVEIIMDEDIDDSAAHQTKDKEQEEEDLHKAYAEYGVPRRLSSPYFMEKSSSSQSTASICTVSTAAANSSSSPAASKLKLVDSCCGWMES